MKTFYFTLQKHSHDRDVMSVNGPIIIFIRSMSFLLMSFEFTKNAHSNASQANRVLTNMLCIHYIKYLGIIVSVNEFHIIQTSLHT